jgi:hypothetical protein
MSARAVVKERVVAAERRVERARSVRSMFEVVGKLFSGWRALIVEESRVVEQVASGDGG